MVLITLAITILLGLYLFARWFFIWAILFEGAIAIIFYFNDETKKFRHDVKQFKLKIINFSEEQKLTEIIFQKDFISTFDDKKSFCILKDEGMYLLEFKIRHKFIDILQNSVKNVNTRKNTIEPIKEEHITINPSEEKLIIIALKNNNI